MSAKSIDPAAKQLIEITETIVAYAQLDFSQPPIVYSDGPLDAVAAGLIALGEELQAALVARDIAERSNEGKTRFLANMSHELRTPLTAIIGSAELLAASSLDPSQQQHLERIDAAASVLERLIGDVLDFSRLEAGALNIEEEPFVLSDVLDQVVSSHRDRAVAKGLELESCWDFEPGFSVLGDAVRLGQVIGNLVDNAIKFTTKGTVTLAAKHNEEGIVYFSIRDTGPGIPSGDHARIFERFSAGDESLRRQHRGAGLGLSIVRALVECMGGEISMDSVLGEGSCFGFHLRLVQVDEAVPNGDEALTGRTLSRHVLVVDDTEVVRLVAVELLLALGCVPEAVSSGRAALALLASGKEYDLILMDCQMPGIDGLETTRQLLAAHPQANLQIVAISAHATDADRAAYRAAGMVDHMPKPFRLADLQLLVLGVTAPGLGPRKGHIEPTTIALDDHHDVL